MDKPSIPPTLDLPDALVRLRDHAHELAEKLEDLWCASGETEDHSEADQLDPLMDEAMVLAATLDAVKHRVTGQPMNRRRPPRHRTTLGPGPAVGPPHPEKTFRLT